MVGTSHPDGDFPGSLPDTVEGRKVMHGTLLPDRDRAGGPPDADGCNEMLEQTKWVQSTHDPCPVAEVGFAPGKHEPCVDDSQCASRQNSNKKRKLCNACTECQKAKRPCVVKTPGTPCVRCSSKNLICRFAPSRQGERSDLVSGTKNDAPTNNMAKMPQPVTACGGPNEAPCAAIRPQETKECHSSS